MTTYDFVQLAFLALGGEVRGKTKLQKLIYFLGLMTGHEKELGYRAHYYGPYSDDVAASVERLKMLGFLDQSITGIGAFDSSGFEVARHDYRLNAEGSTVAKQKAKEVDQEWKTLQESTRGLGKLIDLDYMKLSIAAKTYFLLDRKGEASSADLAALAPKFGWTVSKEEIREAAKILESVRLVQLTDKD